KINDTLGHKSGDAVLKHVAQILSPAVREIDTIARIGGDEFFILALDVADEHRASAIARKILDVLNRPLPGIPEELKLGASIGICLFPYPGMNVTDIIHRADQAMYVVKCGGKNGYSFAEGDRAGYVD
ncbi:MAG: GGDEF domain-containing protein, partial [Campylobacterales bacterium]|nr:GGDEF domain-containing protein [Campylobacterales bacterium]